MAPKRRSSASSSEQRQLKSQKRSSGSTGEDVAEHVEIVKKVEAVVIPKLELSNIATSTSQPKSAVSARRSYKQQQQLLQQSEEDQEETTDEEQVEVLVEVEDIDDIEEESDNEGVDNEDDDKDEENDNEEVDDEEDDKEDNDDEDDDDEEEDDEDDNEEDDNEDDQKQTSQQKLAVDSSNSRQHDDEQDDDTYHSALPMSALAARRLARQRQAEQQRLDGTDDQEQDDSNLESTPQLDMDVSEGSPATDNEPTAVVSMRQEKPARSKKRVKNQPKQKRQKKIGPIDERAISIFNPCSANVSTFNNNGEQYLAIGLQENESIVFVGKALIAVYRGAISIMGATLTADKECLVFHPVFAFKSHALPRIEPTTQTSNVSTRTTDIHEDRQPFVNAFGRLEHFAAVIVIKSLEWCGFDDVDGVFSHAKDMTGIEGYKGHHLMSGIAGFYPILEPTPGIKVLDIPSTWRENANVAIQDEKERGSPLVSIVCGTKDSGKSTFNRYLVNRLLNSHKRVAYLETDVGQTEFTPSGIIALHVLESPILGPPCTHQHIASKRSHYFGAATARDDPNYYMRIARQLTSTWQQDYNEQPEIELIDQVPLVVNTHGWVKGLGYDLLIGIIDMVGPTNVFATQGPTPSFPPTFATDILPPPDGNIQPKLHYIENTVRGSRVVSKYHAADLRALAFISYMYQDLTHFGQPNKPWWNFKTSLVERLPWSLDWRTGLDTGIWILSQDIKLNHLLYALNVSIVALISSDPPSDDDNDAQVQDMDQDSSHSNVEEETKSNITPPKYLPASEYPPPDPEYTHCRGLAIVRAIDSSEHSLLMLTPEVRSTLNEVSGLVKGSMDIPSSCMLDRNQGRGTGIAGVPWRQVPYMTEDAIAGAGGSAMRIRRINKRAG